VKYYRLIKYGNIRSAVFFGEYGNYLFIPEPVARNSNYEGCNWESIEDLMIHSENFMPDSHNYFGLLHLYYELQTYEDDQLVETASFSTRNEFLKIIFPLLPAIGEYFREV
jgi:hypothetical protein